MKLKMKRLWATLLTLAMVIGLIPGAGIAVYADDTVDLSGYLITGEENSMVAAQKQITFNSIKWYVTEFDSTTATLISALKMSKSAFGSNKAYNGSSVQTYLDSLTAAGGSFEQVADAIIPVNLDDVEVTGAKLYIPSQSEVQALKANIRELPYYDEENYGWWTRTPHGSMNAVVYCIGTSFANGSLNSQKGIRPMMKLDLTKLKLKDGGVLKIKGLTNSVSLTGGANATAAPSDAVSQTVEEDESMTTVTYTANEGFKFNDFDPITVNGVTASKTSLTQVTVTGTPTGNVEITIPDAVEVNFFTVALTGGANSTVTPDADALTQEVPEGNAMTEVRFKTDGDFLFDNFETVRKDGLEMYWFGPMTIVVKGTPTADVSLVVPDAKKDSEEEGGGEGGGDVADSDAAKAAAEAKAQGKGSTKPDEFCVKTETSGKKTVFTVSCNVVSGNNTGVLTIPKGDKVMLPGFNKKTAGLEIDKSLLSVNGKGQLSAKKATPEAGSPLSYTTSDGNKVSLKVFVIDPSIESRTVSNNSVSSNSLTVGIKKLSATINGTGSFDLKINAPLTINADTKKAKVKGDIKFASSSYISIDNEGGLHISGTVTGKGTAKIPFTAYGKKYTIKISAKGAPKKK